MSLGRLPVEALVFNLPRLVRTGSAIPRSTTRPPVAGGQQQPVAGTRIREPLGVAVWKVRDEVRHLNRCASGSAA